LDRADRLREMLRDWRIDTQKKKSVFESANRNWEDMEAGIELDRLVAEKHGWTDIHYVDGLRANFKHYYEGIPPGGTYTQELPAFSRSLDAAMLLVDPLDQSDGFSLKCDWYCGKRWWMAEWHRSDGFTRRDETVTPAMAVVRAKLYKLSLLERQEKQQNG